MIIRKAVKEDFKNVMNFYDEVCDALKDAKYSPGWKKGIYPYPDDVYDAINKDTFYIGIKNDEIISCMIVNHEYNVAYKEIKWNDDYLDDEIYVIHMLAISPSLQGKGISKDMIDYVKSLARKNRVKVVRLDILKGHLIAQKAYEKCGFIYQGSIEMYYEDTGNTYYDVYEYKVEEV